MNILGDKTRITGVTLNVKNLSIVQDFYENLVGLKVVFSTEKKIELGFNETTFLTLVERPELTKPILGQAGLYHTAILFENGNDLALALKNIFEKSSHLFEGSGDHLVSQAFYFHDPEGNGVELYIDRPREEWRWENGKVKMMTLYIDPQEFLLSHLNADKMQGEISIGHLHLKVGDIDEARQFYADMLGFEIMAEMPTALFVSAGKYHHHLGLNTWESKGAGKRLETLGLGLFEISVENREELSLLAQRFKEQKISFNKNERDLHVEDPWGNKVIVRY